MIEAWEARLAGNSEDADIRYEAARDLARARGFRYLDAGAVSKLPVEDVVARVEAISAPANQPDGIEAAALLRHCPGATDHGHKGAGALLDACEGEDLRQKRGPTAPLGGPAQKGDQELRVCCR